MALTITHPHAAGIDIGLVNRAEYRARKSKKRGRTRKAPKFDLRTQLFQMCGVEERASTASK